MSVVPLATFGLTLMKRLSHMAAVEDPSDCVAGKDVCDLFLRRQHDECRLEKPGTNLWRRFRLRDHDRARRAWLEWMWIWRRAACWRPA